MPNENARVCGCGMVVDLPKSRNATIGTRKLTILNSKKNGKADIKALKKHQSDDRGPKNRTSESGCCSSVNDHARPAAKSNKHEKRLNHSRRTRSAERTESHYTYIDSGSSILGGGLREDTIPEALYATIPEVPNPRVNETSSNQTNTQNQSQAIYAIPSMTSPPPTYDVAIAKTWQSGLPPTYEEYLCHKYAMLSRSRTPPPPWSDTTTTTVTNGQQMRREPLASQQELREYLAQLSLSQGNEHGLHNQQHPQQHQRDVNYLSNQQLRREQQVRAQQRTRMMPPRSQSESRAQQQQRVATMYEDGAFCMETTALQSAFENGVAFCTLM